jgi:F-type H+-transporting ATPase subunit delta
LLEVCGDALSAKVQNFVCVLAENKRVELLPEISTLFEQLKANQERSVDVDVVSAFALDSDLQQRLAQALRSKLQREVTINASVDTSLLGGVLVRAGDVVIDGSVRGRLAKLAQAMTS